MPKHFDESGLRAAGARAAAARTAAVMLFAGLTLALTACSSGGGPTRESASPSALAGTSAPAPTATSALKPRAATAANPLRYVALGDSYSSGLGGGKVGGKCARGSNAYPELLDADKTIKLVHFAACAGATTDDVRTNQLDVLDNTTELVTITIGGNDLGAGALPTACEGGQTSRCRAAVQTSVSLLKTLQAKLAKTYAAIAKAAPHASILVADYPAFYDLTNVATPSFGSDAFASAAGVDAAVSSLDATIEKAVDTQRAHGVNIHFVDVSFAGHGVNSHKPWFVLTGIAAYHPNAAGYRQYATVLRDHVG